MINQLLHQTKDTNGDLSPPWRPFYDTTPLTDQEKLELKHYGPIQTISAEEWVNLNIKYKHANFMNTSLLSGDSGYTNYPNGPPGQDYFICSDARGFASDCARGAWRWINYLNINDKNFTSKPEIQNIKEILNMYTEALCFASHKLKDVSHPPYCNWAINCHTLEAQNGQNAPNLMSIIAGVQNIYIYLLNKGSGEETPYIENLGEECKYVLKMINNFTSQSSDYDNGTLIDNFMTTDYSSLIKIGDGNFYPFPFNDSPSSGGQQLGLNMCYFSCTLQMLSSKFNITKDYLLLESQDIPSSWPSDLGIVINETILDNINDTYWQLFFKGHDLIGPQDISDMVNNAYGANVLIEGVNYPTNSDSTSEHDISFNIWGIFDSGWGGVTVEILSYQLIVAAIFGKYDHFCYLHRLYYYMIYLQNGETTVYTTTPGTNSIDKIPSYTKTSILQCSVTNSGLDFTAQYQNISFTLKPQQGSQHPHIQTLATGTIQLGGQLFPNTYSSPLYGGSRANNTIPAQPAQSSSNSNDASLNIVTGSSISSTLQHVENWLQLANDDGVTMPFTINNAGSDYTENSVWILSQKTNISGTIKIDKVDENGGIILIEKQIDGFNYNTTDLCTLKPYNQQGFTGQGAQISIDKVGGNPNSILSITILNPGIGYYKDETYTIDASNNTSASAKVTIVGSFVRRNSNQLKDASTTPPYMKYTSFLMGFQPTWTNFYVKPVHGQANKPTSYVKNPRYVFENGLRSASDADFNIWIAYRLAELCVERDPDDAVYGNWKDHDNGDNNIISQSAAEKVGCTSQGNTGPTWKYMRTKIGECIGANNGGYFGFNEYQNPNGNFVPDVYYTNKQIVSLGHDTDKTQPNLHPDYADFALIWQQSNIN